MFGRTQRSLLAEGLRSIIDGCDDPHLSIQDLRHHLFKQPYVAAFRECLMVDHKYLLVLGGNRQCGEVFIETSEGKRCTNGFDLL